jgi:FkbM family methyltransferase
LEKYTVKEILGSKMYLITKDGGISKQLLKYGIREEGATRETTRLLKPNMTAIDIGANLGYYALLEAKMCKFVYAIEPVKENVEPLKKGIELNNYRNIEVHRCAIGAENKHEEMIITHKSNLCSVFLDQRKSHYPQNKKAVKERRQVKVMTLSKFCKRLDIKRVDFIRMDVEGYEGEVIKGMNKMIKLMPLDSVLTIEIHPKAYNHPYTPILEMLDRIKSYGFEVKRYTLMDNAIDVDSFDKLKSMFDNKYCPQVFFRKV